MFDGLEYVIFLFAMIVFIVGATIGALFLAAVYYFF